LADQQRLKQNFYRFRKTETERLSMIKGEDSWYTIYDFEQNTLLCCHVLGNCAGGVTVHPDREDPRVLFRFEPKGKLFNMTYFVCEGSDGPLLATIKLFATRGLKILDVVENEICRVVDARASLDKIAADVLEGACTSYKLARGSESLGTFRPRKRPAIEVSPNHGFIRKAIIKALGSASADWSLDLEENAGCVEDHRPLLAAMILLKEQTIRMDQST
jgi:hypothetical protein